jgi:hypothetical protein
MSDQVRKALAVAASTVEGVTCLPYYVQTTTPGAAFVRVDRTEYPDQFGGIRHWNVIVILPQDMGAAEAWVEAHEDALVKALQPELVVTQVQPQRLNTDAGVLLCVFINGHREKE